MSLAGFERVLDRVGGVAMLLMGLVAAGALAVVAL
jgi:hypothetical protein